MWSAVVFEPAFPGRSIAASISWVLSHHTPIGWYPNPPLNVAAADSFSECTVTSVASTSSTTVSPRSVPATFEAGSPPRLAASWAHTCRRTLARAFSTRRIAAGVSSSRVRHTVGADATGPSTWRWWRSTSMSAIASPPSASSTARSTSTRPRSWTGRNERRANAVDRPPVSPTRSASSRIATDPACATTPVPSAVTDNPDDHVICFTREVPSARAC